MLAAGIKQLLLTIANFAIIKLAGETLEVPEPDGGVSKGQ
jgi:hypothetical protein